MNYLKAYLLGLKVKEKDQNFIFKFLIILKIINRLELEITVYLINNR